VNVLKDCLGETPKTSTARRGALPRGRRSHGKNSSIVVDLQSRNIKCDRFRLVAPPASKFAVQGHPNNSVSSSRLHSFHFLGPPTAFCTSFMIPNPVSNFRFLCFVRLPRGLFRLPHPVRQISRTRRHPRLNTLHSCNCLPRAPKPNDSTAKINNPQHPLKQIFFGNKTCLVPCAPSGPLAG